MTAIDTGLSNADARVREQALMMAFATLGAANLINSISPSKWSQFQTEIDRLSTLLSHIP